MTVAQRIDQLLADFSRRRLDVPDGLFDSNAAFRLNGIAYETILGRSTDDPLVRLIARGPAGYRFVAQGLLHALADVSAVALGLGATDDGATATIVLTGTLRGSAGRFEATLGVSLTLTPAGAIASARVTMEQGALGRLKAARALD